MRGFTMAVRSPIPVVMSLNVASTPLTRSAVPACERKNAALRGGGAEPVPALGVGGQGCRGARMKQDQSGPVALTGELEALARAKAPLRDHKTNTWFNPGPKRTFSHEATKQPSGTY